jgi:putative phosphoribosyl transferase
LVIPRNTNGIVLFAHGSGSSRHSPRNRYVAEILHEKTNLATLLIDLLTQEEEVIDLQTRYFRFNINLLAERLIAATDWILQNELIQNLGIGYFGASTGAAAALVAAAERSTIVGAIVSRGGRPDLAGPAYLPRVQAPTLLIVGGEDVEVISLNQKAFHQLQAKEKKLVIVPGATHLFEEPDKLEEVARIAADWFKHHLRRTAQ